jgi:alkaline phosphatase D
MSGFNRRIFVFGGATAVGALALSGWAPAATFPFTLGIASGDPLPDGVVLWTRLAPSPLNADGHGGMPNQDIPVDWEVATDEAFASIVGHGTVTATYAAAHSVHVEVGGLRADFDYFYRFRAQGHISPVGRTRTAPAVGTAGRELPMAFTSCAHYETGYYTAYRRMAEDHPGLVLHLGDYIYEGGASSTGVRQHLGAEIVSLADYRRRYAQYKTDADLQAAHAAAPWVVVPDDHEVENNYAGFVRANNSPALTDAQWRQRRADAYQAYYENMPLRGGAQPSGGNIQLYRRVRWGTLATFHMLDTRQFRNDQTCGDVWTYCPEAGDPARSLPGATQESWLLDGLGQRLATWDVIGQQVFFARRWDANDAFSQDGWDGYPASRDRIQKGWVQRGVPNPVVLTGDVHRAWANNLKVDFTNPASPVVGTELVSSSVSSDGDGADTTGVPDSADNPHLKFYANHRGYVRTTISPTRMAVDFRAVKKVTTTGQPAVTLKSYVIEAGRPGLQDLP